MRYIADVRGGLHSNYAGTLTGIDPNLIDHRTHRAAMALDGKGEYVTRKLLDTLIGAAPGVTANLTYPEIIASQDMGGMRPVVNTSMVNRATTAQDVIDLKTAITNVTTLTTMPNPVYNGDRNPLGTR